MCPPVPNPDAPGKPVSVVMPVAAYIAATGLENSSVTRWHELDHESSAKDHEDVGEAGDAKSGRLPALETRNRRLAEAAAIGERPLAPGDTTSCLPNGRADLFEGVQLGCAVTLHPVGHDLINAVDYHRRLNSLLRLGARAITAGPSAAGGSWRSGVCGYRHRDGGALLASTWYAATGIDKTTPRVAAPAARPRGGEAARRRGGARTMARIPNARSSSRYQRRPHSSSEVTR